MQTSWTNWIHSCEWAREDRATIPMLPAHVRELVELAFDPEVQSRRIAALGELFLGGLLHDIGKLLILKLAHEYTTQTSARPSDEEIGALTADRHAQMGGWLAGR